MDFEQALRAEGTVKLAESVDVNSLGVDMSPAPNSRDFSSPTLSAKETRTPRRIAPATPVIVPPTPSPTAGPSSARLAAPSPTSSSGDVFYDAEDSNMQTKRRSIYRSPGTSSSPDLATLLRKAKEKGGTIGAHHKLKERRQETPPALPGVGLRSSDRPSSRQRSSTSSTKYTPALAPSPSMHGKDPGGTQYIDSGSNDDWVFTSPRLRKPSDGNGDAKPKKSVRAKTSAFLGKMWGQGTVRERSGTDTSTQSALNASTNGPPSFMGAFAPVVPPLPRDAQRTQPTSPVIDIFTSPRGTSDTTKPLPPIQSTTSHAVSEESLVLVEQQSPLQIRSRLSPSPVIDKSPNDLRKTSNHIKRRSMSVGEIDDMKKNMVESSELSSKMPQDGNNRGWDTALNGILSDFKGELSQLGPMSSSLELRDPSTPARRASLNRSKANGFVFPYTPNQGDLNPTRAIQPTPLMGEDRTSRSSSPSAPRSSTSTEGPIVAPRISSLTHAPSPPVSTQPTLPRSNLKYGPRPLKSRNGFPQSAHAHSLSRDSTRLRMQHRSNASSSEPSLIPIGDEVRIRSLSPMASSQQDLTIGDVAFGRHPSRHEDGSDIEARGKELASRCFAEDEEFLAKEKIAEWLGGHGHINKVSLRYYIGFFNFAGLRLDHAFRRLCAKLYLKAETQQVDRILEAFSRRYWECNPASLYGSASLVHAVAYSLLLLNTDLHVAELTTRMSRSQFVRNTLAAIQTQLHSTSEVGHDDGHSIRGPCPNGQEAVSIGRPKRSASITSWNSISRDTVMSTSGVSLPTSSPHTPVEQQSVNGSSYSVYEPKLQNSSITSVVYNRSWEIDMENMLKEMYNAIKSQQILQPLGSTSGARTSTSSLSPGGPMLRNRSMRGQQQPDRLMTLKRGSIRGLQSILGAPTGPSPYSSNSSIDGRVSPSPSFATSINEGVHAASSSFLTPTLGFASNLSHTIIREAQEDDDRSLHSHESGSTTISITDEELALLGAPWAKEGMLCRKQYWESSGKRAKDKTWMDVFVVIQKGELNMFIFGEHGGTGSGVVGGGNWLDNAQAVGTVDLAHSLAHALPPPGYNRQRPHCMVLTLSNGGVYFFQAGTEELVNEWVSTCNYWAARTSKEPLAGGVSNMEYGWNRVMDPLDHGRPTSNDSAREIDPSDSVSVRSSRSTRSRLRWKDGSGSTRPSHSPFADKIYINDWKPPLPPTVSSVHDEESQMEALQKHVSSMKKDLQRHNEFRQPMAALYPPRSSNAIKAQSNWEKKSQYLLTEIVKYDSYIDSLQAAMTLRLKRRGEKALERALVVSSPDNDPTSVKWYPEETIPEGDESPVTPSADPQLSAHFHRKRSADTRQR